MVCERVYPISDEDIGCVKKGAINFNSVYCPPKHRLENSNWYIHACDKHQVCILTG